MKEWVRKQLVSPQQTTREVMKTITDTQIGVALVVDSEDHLLGLVVDSDIRKAILRGVDLETPVSEIMTKNPLTVPEGASVEEMILLMRKGRTNRAPVVDSQGQIKDIVFYWKLQEAIQRQISEDLDFALPPKKEAERAKKILVVGAGGYVGSVLCRELLAEGYQVRGVDCLLFGDEPVQDIANHPHFEFIRGDIRHLDILVDSAFGVDAVINLAAIVGDPACDIDVNHSIMVNYFSAKAAADAARHFKVDRYLFASTCAVYGASEEGEVLTEFSAVAPISLYAETKLRTEQGILSLADKDFSPCVFRLATVYGLSPRMRFDLVVNLFTLNALTKGKLTVFGGAQWRPYVHVRDVARAFVLALKADKKVIHRQIFNLGSKGQNYRVKDLAQKVAEGVGNTEIEFKPDQKDNRNYFVGFDKITKALKFSPRWDIQDAVKEIRESFERGAFRDFSDKKYSNLMQQEHLVFG